MRNSAFRYLQTDTKNAVDSLHSNIWYCIEYERIQCEGTVDLQQRGAKDDL